MTKLHKLERKLDKVFNEDFPSLPSNTKKLIVKYLPWISLIGGLLTLWADWDLWRWGHLVAVSTNYITNLTNLYNGGKIIQATNQMSFGIWLSLLILAIEGILFIAAYLGLKNQKEGGWNLVFYGSLVNLAYGIIIAFTSYGGFGSLIWSIIISVVVLYVLFQIRSAYKKTK